ncbi:unnamed protein product [Acanthoscelides obtectus]|uniref:Uncharacterized protein n=1 Tax=Acanthoscelides obtectus TaxID=200917 RepID=A0A9P0JUF1_ACAOB|nr:unnamed protein product [Acanthoscelides obtectus]CAK1640732.1 hypothetical protein AOBTE_LOCUS11898 [Acanthoscelides obtectus]
MIADRLIGKNVTARKSMQVSHQFQALLLPKSVTTDFEGFSDRQHFSDVNGSILRQECLNFSSTLSL